MPAIQATSVGNDKIVMAAKAAWSASSGKPYKWGGHTTSGFDCSGFVCYVLQQAYPTLKFTFETAADLFGDTAFSAVNGTPQLGDLIGFRHGPGTAHDHVGIVYDDSHWIGSQSSHGVEPVSFSNPYWNNKPHFFLRLKAAGL